MLLTLLNFHLPASTDTLLKDGNTIATTGLLSPGTALNVYPDAQVLLYDLRMFGRGGMPHRFSGTGGGPRFLSFLDDLTLLVASGQPVGGIQIMPTFVEDSQHQSQYFEVQYSCNEERLTALHRDTEGIITAGTSHSQVIQFTMKEQGDRPDMELPAYPPAPSGVELDLQQLRQSQSLGDGDIFGHCVLLYDAFLSSVPSFGKTGQQTLLPAPNRLLRSTLREEVQSKSSDFLTTLSSKSLGLHELLQSKYRQQASINHDQEGKRQADDDHARFNPNQLIFNPLASNLVYDTNVLSSKSSEQKAAVMDEVKSDSADTRPIPPQYQRAARPAGAPSFNYSTHNETLLFPGWDCHERHVYIAPVLALLYYIPEYRKAFRQDEIQERILADAMVASKNQPLSIFYDKGELLAEVGFLFHQMDMLSKHALAHQIPSAGVFSPKNFLSTFSQMPEAAALNLLDSDPKSSPGDVAALDLNRRVETFYRCLMHQLDSELGPTASLADDCHVAVMGSCINSSDLQSRQTLIESVQGIRLTIINIFPSSPIPTVNQTRSFVLPLCLEKSSSASKNTPFREVLIASLYTESRIKAYSKVSKTYESVVQKRIVCSLPKLLSLSTSGVKKMPGITQLWDNKNQNGGRWLPSKIELGKLACKSNDIIAASAILNLSHSKSQLHPTFSCNYQ